jgi:lipid-binding SYLF domain-containing protein
MNFVSRIIAVALLTVGSLSTAWAEATPEECQAAVDKLKGLGNVQTLLSEAYGYAILPTVGKGGFVIGGAAGSGCVYANGAQTGTVKMGQVTVGLQLGGQAYSELVLFQNKDTYEEFITGEYQFSADATAVALTYGAAAGAGTEGASASAGETKGTAAWKRGMAIITLAKGGLMYEASVGGQKFNYEAL